MDAKQDSDRDFSQGITLGQGSASIVVIPFNPEPENLIGDYTRILTDDFKNIWTRQVIKCSSLILGVYLIQHFRDGNLHNSNRDEDGYTLPAVISRTEISWYDRGNLSNTDVDIYGTMLPAFISNG